MLETVAAQRVSRDFISPMLVQAAGALALSLNLSLCLQSLSLSLSPDLL